MERLILARHGESVFNVRGALNGDPNVSGGLSPRGREQARRLGAMLADEPIDLCVTTDFQRTLETADIALDDRPIPRLVIVELNDPPAGEFELRPYRELRDWRAENGPDVEIPGTGRTERQFVEVMLTGFEILLARPEASILAIVHGFCMDWILRAVGRSDSATDLRHAEPRPLTTSELGSALEGVRDDLYRYFSI